MRCVCDHGGCTALSITCKACCDGFCAMHFFSLQTINSHSGCSRLLHPSSSQGVAAHKGAKCSLCLVSKPLVDWDPEIDHDVIPAIPGDKLLQQGALLPSIQKLVVGGQCPLLERR